MIDAAGDLGMEFSRERSGGELFLPVFFGYSAQGPGTCRGYPTRLAAFNQSGICPSGKLILDFICPKTLIGNSVDCASLFR